MIEAALSTEETDRGWRAGADCPTESGQWDAARNRLLLYLDGLGVPAGESLELALEALRAAEREPSEQPPALRAMTVLRERLALRGLLQPDGAAAGGCVPQGGPVTVQAAPPIRIGRMHQARFDGWLGAGPLARLLGRCRAGRAGRIARRRGGPSRGGLRAAPAGPADEGPGEGPNTSARPRMRSWSQAAVVRRSLVGILILVTTLMASSQMAGVLPHLGQTGLEQAIVVVYGLLFAWISVGFWEAMAGLFVNLRGGDRFDITRCIRGGGAAPAAAPRARTAVVMPICDESVSGVMAALRTTYESLARTGVAEAFDFFILSDTRDPDTWVEEEAAWLECCRAVNGFGRIHYRHRSRNRQRKSGNIADFLRRWGRRYTYMVVFDADSVMTGEALAGLVEMMEKNPKVGIIQTAPQAVNRESFLARVQQFSSRVYAPMLNAGLHFLQLGDSHYWGHNAILRVEPFMRHCGLPRLPGKPPLGGEILSHDFVEAALMRGAGWEVWLAYGLEGSYEVLPTTLHDELKRERRWCQGNLQHLRIVFKKGLYPAHRALFLHGVLSYGSAVLWCLFLCLSTAAAVLEAFRTPDYFPLERSLFPHWPVWQPRWALTLLAMTAVLLFLPKLVSTLAILVRRGKRRGYGGAVRLLCGMAAEVLLSAVMAPIRMFYHCKFVLLTLLGREGAWRPQQRGDHGTRWGDALRFHLGATALGLAWAGVLFVYNRSFFWWNLPVFLPLLISVPVSVLSGSTRVGRAVYRLGLFLIPEETFPPPEMARLVELERGGREGGGRAAAQPEPWNSGFVRAVADPRTHALHRCVQKRVASDSAAVRRRRDALRGKALSGGPDGLTAEDRRALLRDPDALQGLHRAVWDLPSGGRASSWGIP